MHFLKLLKIKLHQKPFSELLCTKNIDSNALFEALYIHKITYISGHLTKITYYIAKLCTKNINFEALYIHKITYYINKLCPKILKYIWWSLKRPFVG